MATKTKREIGIDRSANQEFYQNLSRRSIEQSQMLCAVCSPPNPIDLGSRGHTDDVTWHTHTSKDSLKRLNKGPPFFFLVRGPARGRSASVQVLARGPIVTKKASLYRGLACPDVVG